MTAAAMLQARSFALARGGSRSSAQVRHSRPSCRLAAGGPSAPWPMAPAAALLSTQRQSSSVTDGNPGSEAMMWLGGILTRSLATHAATPEESLKPFMLYDTATPEESHCLSPLCSFCAGTGLGIRTLRTRDAEMLPRRAGWPDEKASGFSVAESFGLELSKAYWELSSAFLCCFPTPGSNFKALRLLCTGVAPPLIQPIVSCPQPQLPHSS